MVWKRHWKTPAKLTTGIGNTFSVKYEGTTYWFININDTGTRCVYMGTGDEAGANTDASLGNMSWEDALTKAADTMSKPYLALASKYDVTNVATADDVNCSLMTYAEGYKISGDVRLQIWRAADRYYWVGTRYGEGTARFVNSDSVIHYCDEGYGYACIPAFTISAKG